MKSEIKPLTQPPVPRASGMRRIMTAIGIVLVGGLIGIGITVGLRALLEVQQQLGSGAAPGLLALIVKLIYTALSLLAVSADAVVDGASAGLGVGLLVAIIYWIAKTR